MEVYIKGGHGYDCFDIYDTYIMLCSAIIAVYSKGVFPDEASTFISHPVENDSDIDMSEYLATHSPSVSPPPRRGRTATI